VKIILAESAGFCFGVKRAARLALDSSEKYHQICSLGPLIHSPQLVQKLEEKGVRVVERVEDLPEGAVIVRSHGLTADEFARLSERNLTIIDATCPFVKKAQEYASQLSRDGYAVVLVGEAEHPEVQGIISYVEEAEVFVVADREAAESLPRRPRFGVIAQTTQSFGNLEEIVAICLHKGKEVRVFNTICDATAVRQEEARDIARQVDLVLVIGGFNSANTTRLAKICQDIQPCSHHIETADQIDPDWFRGTGSVGITAGASTPKWIIDQVLDRVREISK